jgi:hypothetical protein
MLHEITYALDGVVTGKVYSIRIKAQNSAGFSDYSEYLIAACIAPPE